MSLSLLGLAALVVAAEPTLDSRLFIATGAKTEAEAKRGLRALKVPPALLLAPGYPRVVESRTVAGLKPGFFLVVLGACPDVTGAQKSHANGLAALVQRALKGAYAKPVTKQSAAACPLWLEPGEKEPPEVTAVRTRRDEVTALYAAARALELAGDLLGADILLRRALALGAEDEATLGLYRKVEFILEDAPWHLPP